MNRKLKLQAHIALAAVGIALILMGGCASSPRQIAELDQARTEVNAVAQDPLAREAASSKLEAARVALKRADEAAEKRRPVEEIQQDAYLALRNAQIAREQIAEMRLRKEIEQGEAERNRVLLQARSQEAAAAKAHEADAAAVAIGATAEAERLRAELTELQAKATERGMVLTLGDVLFDTGQATLKPGAHVTLDRVADFVLKHDGVNVLIEGHTDSVGPDEYNLALSLRRADAVRFALQQRGVSPARIQARGMGEAYPVASNDTSAGRQQNRRVELVFSDDKGIFNPSAERRISQEPVR